MALGATRVEQGSRKKEGAGVFRPDPQRPTNPFPEVPNALNIGKLFHRLDLKSRILILREISERVGKNSADLPHHPRSSQAPQGVKKGWAPGGLVWLSEWQESCQA